MFVLFILALAKLTEHIRIDTGVFLHPFEGNEVDDISRCVHHHIGCQRFQPYGRYPDTVKGVIISLLNVFLNVVNLNVKRRKLFFEVDGRYVDALRNLSLKFRGSSNQRLIDMNKTRENGEVTLLSE